MPAYVIYARKSTESEDRQVLSIESQVTELTALAARQGVAVGEILRESRSAKAPGRPVFGALMQRVRRGEVAGILCWKMDRLARNHLDTGTVLQALADSKLPKVLTPERTYTHDGNDRFMGSFELGMATKYIDDLRANVKRGNRARFQRGWPNFIPPLGYLNDRVTKTVVKDPERFDRVRQIWDLFLTGSMRPEQIMQVANRKWHFRTRQFKRQGGKPLSRSVTYKLLTNPYYMGVIRLRSGEVYPGAHPPMITREEFDRAQELLGRPGRPRPVRHEFPFTGLIKCGHCGGGVTAEEHIKPKTGKRYAYYRCSRYKTDVRCAEPPLSERDLEAQIVERLRGASIPQKLADWALARLKRSLSTEDGRREQIRAGVEQSVKDLEREVQNLLELRLRELVTDDIYVAKNQQLQEQLVLLRRKLAQPVASNDALLLKLSKLLDVAVTAPQTFANGTSVQKRTILETVGLNYQLTARTLSFIGKKPFLFFNGTASRLDWCTIVDDLRTWLLESDEYLPLIDGENVLHEGSLAGNAGAA